MQNVVNILLKHGLENLILENEEFFKQNITKALALKLHESFQEIKSDISKNLLLKNIETESSESLTEFVSFIQNFKPGNYKFKNESIINISESDIHLLKNLFECLNTKNREQMVLEILKDGNAFKQHIKFSQKVKNLL